MTPQFDSLALRIFAQLCLLGLLFSFIQSVYAHPFHGWLNAIGTNDDDHLVVPVLGAATVAGIEALRRIYSLIRKEDLDEEDPPLPDNHSIPLGVCLNALTSQPWFTRPRQQNEALANFLARALTIEDLNTLAKADYKPSHAQKNHFLKVFLVIVAEIFRLLDTLQEVTKKEEVQEQRLWRLAGLIQEDIVKTTTLDNAFSYTLMGLTVWKEDSATLKKAIRSIIDDSTKPKFHDEAKDYESSLVRFVEKLKDQINSDKSAETRRIQYFRDIIQDLINDQSKPRGDEPDSYYLERLKIYVMELEGLAAHDPSVSFGKQELKHYIDSVKEELAKRFVMPTDWDLHNLAGRVNTLGNQIAKSLGTDDQTFDDLTTRIKQGIANLALRVGSSPTLGEIGTQVRISCDTLNGHLAAPEEEPSLVRIVSRLDQYINEVNTGMNKLIDSDQATNHIEKLVKQLTNLAKELQEQIGGNGTFTSTLATITSLAERLNGALPSDMAARHPNAELSIENAIVVLMKISDMRGHLQGTTPRPFMEDIRYALQHISVARDLAAEADFAITGYEDGPKILDRLLRNPRREIEKLKKEIKRLSEIHEQTPEGAQSPTKVDLPEWATQDYFIHHPEFVHKAPHRHMETCALEKAKLNALLAKETKEAARLGEANRQLTRDLAAATEALSNVMQPKQEQESNDQFEDAKSETRYDPPNPLLPNPFDEYSRPTLPGPGGFPDPGITRPSASPSPVSELSPEILAIIEAIKGKNGGNNDVILKDCLAGCPPQFDGICRNWFNWKRQMSRILAPHASKVDANGSQTFALYASAFCGTFADWFWATQNHIMRGLNATSTLAQASQYINQIIEQELGLNDSDIRRQRRREWDCPNIEAECWSDFIMKLETLALEAGLTTGSVTADKLLSTLPAGKVYKLHEIAVSQGFKDAEDLDRQTIKNAMAALWKRNQVMPRTEPCGTRRADGSCPKGKGDACKCKPHPSSAPIATEIPAAAAPITTPRSYAPSCREHRFTPNAVFSDLIKLQRSNNDSASFSKYCHDRGLCELCKGVTNAAKFEEAFPDAGPPGRPRSEARRSPPPRADQ